MIRMIKVEMEKLFCSRRFYLSIVGIILGLQMTSVSFMKYSLHSTVSDMYLQCSGEAFSLVCFLLCVVGGGISFCIEQRSQSVRYIVLRGNTTNYAIGKILSAFLGGYLITLIGFVLGELSLSLTLYVQQGNWNVFTSCMDSIGLDMLENVVRAFRYGILSVVAVVASVFIPDLFITMVMPIVVYYAYLNIMGWFKSFPPFLDMLHMVSGHYSVDDFAWNQFFGDMERAVLFSLCVVYGMGCMIVKGMKWRVEHG